MTLLEELLYTLPVLAEASLHPGYAQHSFRVHLCSLLSLARHWAGEPGLQRAFQRAFRGLLGVVGDTDFMAVALPALVELTKSTPAQTMAEVLEVIDSKVSELLRHTSGWQQPAAPAQQSGSPFQPMS